MKRQTLLQVVIFTFLLLLMSGIALSLHLRVSRSLQRLQTVRLGSLALEIPEAFGAPKSYRDQAWEVQEYRGSGLGTLRLATEPGDGTTWESLCSRWFGLRDLPSASSTYSASGALWFFKGVPLHGKGAYVLRKQGKQVRFIGFFEREGIRHWIGFDTRDPFTPHKEVFDRMLLSLQLPDGSRPGPELARSLQHIAGESRYRFVQPAAILPLIPAVAILLITIIQAVVRWRSGRLPVETVISAATPIFEEGGVELGLVRPFQWKFMDCAVSLTKDALIVHTFGTPFMVVDRGHWKGAIGTGQAWLGLPFVTLELEQPPVFRKWAWAYRGMKAPLKVRIYTRNADRLRALLQS